MDEKPRVIERKPAYPKKKKLRCPFDPVGLECEDCRLYQPYIGGQGKKDCIFILILDALFELKMRA